MSLGQEMYEALAQGSEQSDPAWDFATRLDAAVVASVARKHLFRRDVYWGAALSVVTLTGLGMLAWYTPTKTVIVEEIAISDAPDRACLDAMDKAGALFEAISQITTKSAERDVAEEEAHDALSAMDWSALQDAATRTFAINTQMEDLVEQAKGVDISTPAKECRG